MAQIDSMIKPVANAINKTGLLEVFVGLKPNYSKDKDDYMDKGKVEIYCKPLSTYSLNYIELFVERILRDYVKNSVHWNVNLLICKRYIPDSDIDSPIEFSFDFILKSFNPNLTEIEQIKEIKKGLNYLEKSIIRNSKSINK